MFLSIFCQALMGGGDSDVDLEDLKRHTVYSGARLHGVWVCLHSNYIC